MSIEEIDIGDLYLWLCDANDVLIEGRLSRKEVESILGGNSYFLSWLTSSIEIDFREQIKTFNFMLRGFYLLHRRPKTDKNLELISRLAIEMWFFIEKVSDKYLED
jgi:hypothetical protein